MSANEQKTSRELAIIAAQAADEKKATDILVQDVAELVGETDFFVGRQYLITVRHGA